MGDIANDIVDYFLVDPDFVITRAYRRKRNMAKNTTAYLVGPVLYANIFEKNKITKGDYCPEGGVYQITIGLDDNDSEMVEDWNHLYKGKNKKHFTKKDKNGNPRPLPEGFVDDVLYYTFKRDAVVLNKDGEEIEEWGGAPDVVDAEGNEWDGGLVGNGSICTLKLNVFEGKNGEGKPFTKVRLDGVRVEKHVPYEPSGEETEEGEVINKSGGLPF